MLQHGRITTALAIATTGAAFAATPALAQPAGDVVEPATPPQPTPRADIVVPARTPLPAPRADVVQPSRAPLPTPRADVVVPTHSPQVVRVDFRSPDTRDIANGRGPQTFAPSPVVRIVPTGTGAHGFDWGDAGIGAGGAIALVLLASGGVMLTTRRRGHFGTSGPSALAS